MIPSSIAAFAAFRALVALFLFLRDSAVVAPPTLNQNNPIVICF